MRTNVIKRITLCGFISVVLTIAISAQQNLPVKEGLFKPTEESMKQYKYPEWFRDAKFGFWAIDGPESVPRQGDWYARNMYMEGSADYKYHLAHYGHPSVFGYKDIIPLWKAEKWDPEKLMKLYKKAGAKYFFVLATHHDNFFLWDSKINRWNSVNMGPKKDFVGLWQQATKKQGLKFGISEHLGATYNWFQVAHGSDKAGPKAGVPYDGADLNNQDLYHAAAIPGTEKGLTSNPAWQLNWYRCIKELVDNYQPDLLYSDSAFPFGDVGRAIVTYFYNQNMAKNGGKLEAVYNCKQPSNGMWVQDVERGILDTISPYPWQTDTSIGDWYYKTGQKYKTATKVIQMLVDIVSKNGNLLLNIISTPEGDLEPDVLATVEEIGVWTTANGEGIYGSRPWKIYGEKPQLNAPVVRRGNMNENFDFTAKDIRFTTQGTTIYAFCLGKPTVDIMIKSLGKASKLNDKAIVSISMVGSKEKISWKQNTDALVIKKPAIMPAWEVIGFKIDFKK